VLQQELGTEDCRVFRESLRYAGTGKFQTFLVLGETLPVDTKNIKRKLLLQSVNFLVDPGGIKF